MFLILRSMKQLKRYLKEKKEKNLKRSWLRSLINLFLEKGLKVEELMVCRIKPFLLIYVFQML